MPKKRKNPSKSKGSSLWIVVILGVAAVGAIAVYLMRPDSTSPSTTPLRQPDVSVNTKPLHKQSVSVLKPEYSGGKLTFTKKTEVAVGEEAPQVYAINSFLKSTGIVSPEAKLDSMEVKDGVAILKFNKAFEATYGTEDERTIVEGILRTLGQYPEINKAKFQIGDQSLETLGNIELLDPRPVIRSKQ